MRGQVELLSSILATEREELQRDPDAAHAALEDILKKDGLSKDSAHTAAIEIGNHPDKAMAVYARGKLGINPEELGSVWGSAGSSFVMFSLGAFLPLIPWLISGGTVAIITSLGLAVVGALGIGAYLGYTTGGHILKPALRQLLVLILAAGLTYLVGRLFGTQTG
jgi:VIT1/CCC1 family predicted Fe2+/Mn2+ transporter